ncbi:MAG: TatD family hydrolase [Bacteroidales bacterium]|nr:TatD family hydrolase [Bacteroidales bacterium]
MNFIDTHSHIYLQEFDQDRTSVVENALNEGVKEILLPNVDSGSIDSMLRLCKAFPENCFPMMGLHPTSVKENVEDELAIVEKLLKEHTFIAIGEIGIDLYWDKTFLAEQEEAFRYQVRLAKKHNLPIVIHSRDSFDELFALMDELYTPELKGVFHCFTGNENQAQKIISDYNFKLGIGGVLTFKNSGLADQIKNIDLSHLILETDAPYLAPVPYRGKRNQPVYIPLIAQKLAEVKKISIEEIAEITTKNAKELFNL